MKVLIIYCHPSKNSFTHEAKENFIRGLVDGGHTYEVTDLYEMHFQAEFSEKEYMREAFYREDLPLEADVIIEQEKIQNSDAIVFIYPVFWTEAPAKLVGWFDRVWTYGFAYGAEPVMKILNKALCIVVAGKTLSTLIETSEMEAMKTVMLGDRIRNRAKIKEFIILDGTSRYDMDNRESMIEKHLQKAYELGRNF